MIFTFETEPLQYCPECAAAGGGIDADCWRCGGDGVVPIYDPLSESFKIRIHGSGDPDQGPGRIRVRPSLEVLGPRIELPGEGG